MHSSPRVSCYMSSPPMKILHLLCRIESWLQTLLLHYCEIGRVDFVRFFPTKIARMTAKIFNFRALPDLNAGIEKKGQIRCKCDVTPHLSPQTDESIPHVYVQKRYRRLQRFSQLWVLDTCWVAQLVAGERCFGLVNSYIAHSNDIQQQQLTTLLDPKIHDLTSPRSSS